MSDRNSKQGCVWITGASSGLGAALAVRMAQAGFRVAVSARRADKLDELARSTRAAAMVFPVPLDTTDPEAVRHAVRRIETEFAPIKQAVLNAGTHVPVRADNLDVEAFRKLIDVNLMGTVHGLAAALEVMVPRRSGRIAIVASLAGYRGLPTASAYGLTKAGLINMSEALRPELERLGIILQLVNPGFVKTPLTDRNSFTMPFLMTVEDAADAFFRGLQTDRFEIVFPRRFAYLMKTLRCLPSPLALAITRRLVPKE